MSSAIKPKKKEKKAVGTKHDRSDSPGYEILPDARDFEPAKTKPSERRKAKHTKEVAKVKAEKPESASEDEHSASSSDDDGSDSDTSDTSETSMDDAGPSLFSRMTAPRRATKVVLPWSRKANKKEMLKSLNALATFTPKSRMGCCCVQQIIDCWLGDPAQTDLQTFFADMKRELLARGVKLHRIRSVREGLCRGAAAEIVGRFKWPTPPNSNFSRIRRNGSVYNI